MNKNNIRKILERIKTEDFCFANYTTYRCGGKARLAYFPKSFRQCIALYDYLQAERIKFITLGNGSNILASDNFFDGVVISTKNLSGVYRTGENTIFCRAGTKITALLKYCTDNGCGGLEYLAGIPATIGGIAYMNGGAGGIYIEKNVASVKLYDGKIRNFSNKYCNFGYKYSTMRDINCFILGVELKITPKNSNDIKQEICHSLEKRKMQPKGASCGCVFKNPQGLSAGKLIDEAGLKGLSVGGAYVSSEHANFIINSGKNACDVYKLINEVKRNVYESCGILLEEEVIYIGDF